MNYIRRNVYISHGNLDYERLILNLELVGYPIKIVHNLTNETDLVVFTGGSDVTPEFYGEISSPKTHSDIRRDIKDLVIWNKSMAWDIPVVGICRGAQFVCVMNGGSLIQHIEGHAIKGNHKLMIVGEGIREYSIEVNSTHHQAMVPMSTEGFPDTEIIGWCEDIPEIVFWPNSLSLGIQYHPETMPTNSDGYQFFLRLVKDYLL